MTTAPATIVTAADITRGQLVTAHGYTFRVYDMRVTADAVGGDIRLWGTVADIDAGFPRDGIRVSATLTLAPAGDMPRRVVLSSAQPVQVVDYVAPAPDGPDGTPRVWLHLANGDTNVAERDQLLSVDAKTTAALALIDMHGRDTFPAVRTGGMLHAADGAGTICGITVGHGAASYRGVHMDVIGCASCIRELGTLAVRGYTR